MAKKPKIVSLLEQFGSLKQQEKTVKEQIKQVTVDLYMAMNKVGTDKIGTNDIGSATAVYKTEILISPQGLERIQPIDDALRVIKSDLETKQEEREEVAKTLLMEGLAKEDKVFSFIKYTAPKVKEAVVETK